MLKPSAFKMTLVKRGLRYQPQFRFSKFTNISILPKNETDLTLLKHGMIVFGCERTQRLAIYWARQTQTELAMLIANLSLQTKKLM